MKKYMNFVVSAMILSVSSISCGQNVQDLETSVQASVQKDIDAIRSQLPCDLKVTKVSLVNQGGNSWTGAVSIQGPAQSHDVGITVTGDSSKYVYQFDLQSLNSLIWY